jgi:hypothetical protein
MNDFLTLLLGAPVLFIGWLVTCVRESGILFGAFLCILFVEAAGLTVFDTFFVAFVCDLFFTILDDTIGHSYREFKSEEERQAQ